MQQLVIKNQLRLKDFFDTKKFPGKRAIYKGAMSNLEIAITADGVNPGKGSDLTYRKLEADGGIDRAMAMLESTLYMTQTADVYSGMLELNHQNY
jgi:putative spermidine/putrescine transport system substrate-binding protein